VADEKQLAEIAFHEDVVERAELSPLQLIREKETEISGRVLAAKKQADDVVSDARRKAADIVAKAEAADGDRVAQEVEDSAIAAAEQEAAESRNKAETDAVALAKTLSAKRAGAAEAIVKAVTEV
jgi:vacuolar-type H+-ATPase subunit H